MTQRTSLITAAILTVIAGLGVADALFVERSPFIASLLEEHEPAPEQVAKQAGPDVLAAIADVDLTPVAQNETNFLQQIVPAGTPVQYRALLKDNDRVGSVTWVDSPSVKTYFLSLKEALLKSFSKDLQDLRDNTSHETGRPVTNTLSFIDPALSADRFTFIRVRERLYEIHAVRGKEDVIDPLIEALTQ